MYKRNFGTAVKYRITMLRATDPEKLGTKKVPREDVRLSPRRGN